MAYRYGMHPGEFWNGYFDECVRFITANNKRVEYERSKYNITLEVIRWVGYVLIGINRKRGSVLRKPQHYLRLPHEKESGHVTSRDEAIRVRREHEAFTRKWLERIKEKQR